MKTEEREMWFLRQGTGTSLLLKQQQLVHSTASGKSLELNTEADRWVLKEIFKKGDVFFNEIVIFPIIT